MLMLEKLDNCPHGCPDDGWSYDGQTCRTCGYPAAMTKERAHEIVVAICDLAFISMGLGQRGARRLGGLSLRAMLDAKAIVEASDAQVRAAARETGVGYTTHTVPDDRLIAAAYVLEHYQPSDDAILAVPYGDFGGKNRVLAVVAMDDADLAANAEKEDG